MARKFTLDDDQSGNLLSLIRREYYAPCALERERAAAEELYQVVTLTPHTPDQDVRPDLQREANVRNLVGAARWVVKLFGTDDPTGQEELRAEVRKLREALRAIRCDDHPLMLKAEA